MNDSSAELITQYRTALSDCKHLYIQAARVALQDQAAVSDETRRDLIRRMVDLHQGLLVKIYTSVARADSRWSSMERLLACELVDHLWQERLEGDKLQEVARRMFTDAGRLQWYSLLRPFDRIAKIRTFVPELQTIVLRVANLVAKADGTVTPEEADAIRAIQDEIQVHLCRIQLDDAAPDDSVGGTSAPTQIIHREPTLLQTSRAQEQQQLQQQQQQQQQQTDAVEPTGAELNDSLSAALRDLDELIGLDQIKKEVRTLTNYLKLQQRRQEAHLPVQQLSLHMVFAGNPGTGKTTVARIVGRIFKLLGLLKRGHLVETDRAGLVAEYAGQTAPKTHHKIDEALDGILFIDEAYSLVAREREDAYGSEALQVLVKRMEDDRQRLVVIIAGYPEPIDQLLHSNPGLSSRFNTHLRFDDYLPTELARIFQFLCAANHYQLPGRARAKLLLGFQWLYDARDAHFGNGRLVRNTFENSVRRLADRVASAAPVTRELLTVLTDEDITLCDVPDGVWQQLDDPGLRFEVSCPACRKSVPARPDQLGRAVGCPHCRARMQPDFGRRVK